MALRLGFIGIVTRDMSASLSFCRLLGAPASEGSDESHVDTRIDDGTVLAWDAVDRIRSFDPVCELPSGGHRIALPFDQGAVNAVDDIPTSGPSKQATKAVLSRGMLPGGSATPRCSSRMAIASTSSRPWRAEWASS